MLPAVEATGCFQEPLDRWIRVGSGHGGKWKAVVHLDLMAYRLVSNWY